MRPRRAVNNITRDNRSNEGTAAGVMSSNQTQVVPEVYSNWTSLFSSTTKSQIGGSLDTLLQVTEAELPKGPPVQQSGLVQGIIAAAIFICFLLGLYAILWKCMVAAPKRQKKQQKARLKRIGVQNNQSNC